MMELVHSDQAVVKRSCAQFIYGKTKCGVSTHQYLVCAGQKLTYRLDLGLGNLDIVHPGRIAQVPLRGHRPIPIKTVLTQRLIRKAGANRSLGNHNDGLLQALVVQLVQRNEHQCPRLARSRGRLDQQVLLTAFGIGALLHGAHAQLVCFTRCASSCCCN